MSIYDELQHWNQKNDHIFMSMYDELQRWNPQKDNIIAAAINLPKPGSSKNKK